MPINRRACLLAASSSLLAGGNAQAQAQAQPNSNAGDTVDETWLDAQRSREVKVKLRWPNAALLASTHGATQPTPHPLVIFSHGLGDTREGGSVWGEAWAAAGFVVVHIQHPGSDLAALRAVATSFGDQRGLRSVASPEQLVARWRDVGFVLDEIERRHKLSISESGGSGVSNSLAGELGNWRQVRPNHIGLCGHSFGAHTTMGMAGQRYPAGVPVDEPRRAAFIAFSPTAPSLGDAKLALAALTRPMLSITGTRDSDVAGVGATPERRFAVFGALPDGNKAHLVLQDADHMSFAGQAGRAVEIVRREQVTRDLQASHHALISRITTDWWRATLLEDSAAKQRLQAPSGLASGDLWQQ